MKTALLISLFVLLVSGGAIAGIGDPFSGLTPDQQAAFDDGKEAFEEEEDILDGLGPIFNGTFCAQCHSNPTVGGDSNTVETRFGTTEKNKFDALEDLGGSLIQSQGIGTVMCKDGTFYTFNTTLLEPVLTWYSPLPKEDTHGCACQSGGVARAERVSGRLPGTLPAAGGHSSSGALSGPTGGKGGRQRFVQNPN
jgi:hypothetical protein